jgi:dolichol-phosphate mannosyltransferase
MKLLIIPTLNERKNITTLFNKIRKNNQKIDILFVDDNSTDGTREEILYLKKRNKSIYYIFRPRKLGIGSAHKDGLKFAYKKNYQIILTMDADGTHNPRYIKNLIKYSTKYDIISTNRFKKKDSLIEWPMHRRFLTKIRFYLINILLNINYDSSGAYRCYNAKNIKLNDVLGAKNDGYSFFWESLYLLNKKKYSIKEIPIYLPYRKAGSSKMTMRDIIGSLLYLFKYSIKNLIY